MSDVACVIFYAGKMLQTIEFPSLNINLFEGPLYLPNEKQKTYFLPLLPLAHFRWGGSCGHSV
jgi:hypothetical protein